jgi:UDP-glucose 4-epimerase
LKVLIIGGFGFIGKHVLENIPDTHTVAVFSDPASAEQNQSFAKEHRLQVITGDITNPTQITETFRAQNPDVTIHLAALTGLTKCNLDSSLAFSINVFGTYNVIMGCVAAKSKLVFISSREVYGEGNPTGRTTEETELKPNNVYGTTKMLAEDLMHWAKSRYGLKYTILRLTNVYGPGGEQYNIQAMIRSAKERGLVPLYGGNQLMNLVYVNDVATVIINCLTNPRTTDEVFNVGSDEDMTVEAIVKELISQLPMPVQIQRMPMRTGETISFRPDLQKMNALFADLPKTSFQEGIRKTISAHHDTAAPQRN